MENILVLFHQSLGEPRTNSRRNSSKRSCKYIFRQFCGSPLQTQWYLYRPWNLCQWQWGKNPKDRKEGLTLLFSLFGRFSAILTTSNHFFGLGWNISKTARRHLNNVYRHFDLRWWLLLITALIDMWSMTLSWAQFAGHIIALSIITSLNKLPFLNFLAINTSNSLLNTTSCVVAAMTILSYYFIYSHAIFLPLFLGMI